MTARRKLYTQNARVAEWKTHNSGLKFIFAYVKNKGKKRKKIKFFYKLRPVHDFEPPALHCANWCPYRATERSSPRSRLSGQGRICRVGKFFRTGNSVYSSASVFILRGKMGLHGEPHTVLAFFFYVGKGEGGMTKKKNGKFFFLKCCNYWAILLCNVWKRKYNFFFFLDELTKWLEVKMLITM